MPEKAKGDMTVEGAGCKGGRRGGKRGGERTRDRYDHAFYEEIFRKGGQSAT